MAKHTICFPQNKWRSII